MIRKSTHSFDVYKMQLAEEKKQLEQKIYTLVTSGLKTLCDKVTGGSASKVVSVETKSTEDTASNLLKVSSVASVEVCDNEGFKTLNIPVSGTIDEHGLIELTFPEPEILKTKIAEIKTDTGLKSKDQIKARIDGITEFKKAEIENYWKNINKTEVPKQGEVSSTGAERVVGPAGDAATTLTITKVQYPESFKVGQSVPIGGIEYKITGENGGEWVLTRTDLVAPQKEEKKSELKVAATLDKKAEEVKVEETPVAPVEAVKIEEKPAETPVESASAVVQPPVEVKAEKEPEAIGGPLPVSEIQTQTLPNGEKIVVTVVLEENNTKDKGIQG